MSLQPAFVAVPSCRARRPLRAGLLAAAALALCVSPVAGQAGPPHGRGQGQGMHGGRGGQHRGGMDGEHQKDMALFHELGDRGKDIRRTVTLLPNGVQTLTESEVPDLAAKIQAHVLSMSARVKEQRPIHRRDPLFAEIFAHADKIVMKYDNTTHGVRVVETSGDPYVAKLIQAHAEVVSLFIRNGREEMRKNHAVPPRP